MALWLALLWLFALLQPQPFVATLPFHLLDNKGVPLTISEQKSYAHLFIDRFNKANRHIEIKVKERGGQGASFLSAFLSKDTGNNNDVFLFYAVDFDKEKTRKSIEKATQSFAEQFSEKKIALSLKDVTEQLRDSLESVIKSEKAQAPLLPLLQQLSQVIIRRLYLEALSRRLTEKNINIQVLLDFLPPAERNDLDALTKRSQNLQSQLAYMQSQLDKDHPQIKAMEAEKGAIDTQIHNKVAALVTKIRLEQEINTDFEGSLHKKINALSNATSKQLDAVLADFSTRLVQLTAAASQKPSVQFVPLGPVTVQYHKANPLRNIGFIASGFLGAAFIWVFVIWVERRTKPRILPNDKADEVHNITELAQNLTKGEVRFIAIFSAKAYDIAKQLGQIWAIDEQKVLLVNQSQTQNKALGLQRGLNDLLLQDLSPFDAIYRDYDAKLDVMEQGLNSAQQAAPFAYKISGLLDILFEDYNRLIIIFDQQPTYGLEQFAEKLDIFIIEKNYAAEEWIKNMRTIHPKKCILLNDVLKK